MEIKSDKPPNYLQILAKFPNASKHGVLFCYGDIIYNPSKVFIPGSLIEHEKVHSKGQKIEGVEAWWDRYLTDKNFRYEEELAAHRREFQVVMSTLSRSERRSQAIMIAERLASPLYGNMVTVKMARKLLEHST